MEGRLMITEAEKKAATELTCAICGKQYVRQIAGIEEAPEIAEKICQYIYDMAIEFKEEKRRV